MNLLKRSKILMVAEGLYLFEVPVPAQVRGKSIAESSIRERTACSVVAIRTDRGIEVVPSPFAALPTDGHIVLIGSAEAEERFLEIYGKNGAERS
jgi:K+/H+ antiporter YhaU regulatory subunit KhtT